MIWQTGAGIFSVEFQQALALHRQGCTNEAANAYQLVLLAEPTHLDALIHLGAIRLSQRLTDEAEMLLRRATKIAPGSAEAHGNLAAALQAQGRYEEAATHYERALARRPDLLDARLGLAACLQASGRHGATIACYEMILAAETAHPEANYGLATLLARLGRVDEAIAKYRAALAGDPDFAEASHGLGLLLAGAGSREEALSCFLNALDVDPEYIDARLALGKTLSRLDRDEEAMTAFRVVLAVEPDHSEAHNRMGILLDRNRRHAEAIEHFRTALARDPENVDAMGGLANAMKNIGQHPEALAMARRVVALRADYAPAAGLLGAVLAEIGSIDEAVSEFQRAVALAPEAMEYAYHLVQLAKVKPGESALQSLEAAVPTVEKLSKRERGLLYFGLAKAYDDIGEKDRGFNHLLRGNATKRSETEYNEAAMLDGMDCIARVFSPELMAGRENLGDPSNVPVFIVGMPRSGTTLVEQILASHRAVFGAGERPEMSRVVERVRGERLGAASFPEAVWTLTGESFRQMGRDYVTQLRSLAPDAARITDKMPINFLYVGLIHLILPNARIIHTQRDPVDTCLSCFSKLFAGDQPFTYDLAELGRFYRAYQRLMAHWRTVMLPDLFLEVDYEVMVGDFASQAQRIVAHCGLEWDPACLRFYETSRPVHTASMTQVRQPIYSSSVGRWRPDATLLQPLLDGLGGALETGTPDR